MKKILSILAVLMLFTSTTAYAKDLAFTWNRAPENAGAEVGYKIYEGTTMIGEITDGNTTTFSYVSDGGYKCFHATALNAAGVESDPSNEACIDIPYGPINFTVSINIVVN